MIQLIMHSRYDILATKIGDRSKLQPPDSDLLLLRHFMQLLVNGNIQSAPVVTERDDGSKTINLIDILDIVRPEFRICF
jgi:hypothetical protein